MSANDLVDAIGREARRVLRSELGNVVSPFVYASFIAAEVVDPNLSRIQLADGTEARFVPKGAHVTGMVTGSSLLCIKGKGMPLTIAMRVIGSISLAAID